MRYQVTTRASAGGVARLHARHLADVAGKSKDGDEAHGLGYFRK
jgi:hypothetical protein